MSTNTPLLDEWYPKHRTDEPTRTLELLIGDLWRQYPAWPSTFSGCAGEYCENSSRGGHLCPACLSEALIELVGIDLGGKYVETVHNCVVARNAMYAAARQNDQVEARGDATSVFLERLALAPRRERVPQHQKSMQNQTDTENTAGAVAQERLVRLLLADKEQAAFEEWRESTRPSGDAESIRRQWESHWCPTCEGRGEIGGITTSDPGGCSEPCPECNSLPNEKGLAVADPDPKTSNENEN